VSSCLWSAHLETTETARPTLIGPVLEDAPPRVRVPQLPARRHSSWVRLGGREHHLLEAELGDYPRDDVGSPLADLLGDALGLDHHDRRARVQVLPRELDRLADVAPPFRVRALRPRSPPPPAPNWMPTPGFASRPLPITGRVRATRSSAGNETTPLETSTTSKPSSAHSLRQRSIAFAPRVSTYSRKSPVETLTPCA
jgi:hypothetical protein